MGADSDPLGIVSAEEAGRGGDARPKKIDAT